MAEYTSAFYKDLEKKLKDPEFARAYHREGIRIKMIDDLINKLDDARALDGISKVDLARSMQQEPANLRRFFTAKKRNPTMASFIDIAMSLGYKVTLEPLSNKDKKLVSAKPKRALAG